MDLNDQELEFSDLIYAYQSWVMAVINDQKLTNEENLVVIQYFLIEKVQPVLMATRALFEQLIARQNAYFDSK